MKKEQQLPVQVEVVRSFSYKLGQPNYSSVDFFCSVKRECGSDELPEVSEITHQFCKLEVQKSLAAFLEAVAAKEKAEFQAEKEKHNARAAKIEKKQESKEEAKLDAGAQAKDDVEIIPDKQN